MPNLFKNLSLRQVSAITSLIIISLAVPAGLFLTRQSQIAYTPQATLDKTSCQQDSDCGCALDIESGQCAVQNHTYLTGTCTSPDFCSGISGHLIPACINNQCILVGPSPTPTPPSSPTPSPSPNSSLPLCNPIPTCPPFFELVVGGLSQNSQCLTLTCSSINSVSCTASSSAIPQSGTAPYTVRLEPFSASAGGSDAIIGYQWDFEGDGIWDVDRYSDHGWVDHTYNQSGTYQPKYRVRGRVDYSSSCNHPYLITVAASPTPSPGSNNAFDINSDGVINITDYTLFITGFINSFL